MILNIEFWFIIYLFLGEVAVGFVDEMSEAVERLKRKVASLKRESEELQRYKRDIDWIKTLKKKLVRNGFD